MEGLRPFLDNTLYNYIKKLEGRMRIGFAGVACVITILIFLMWISPVAYAEIVVIENEIEEIVGKNQSQEQVEAFALQKAKRLAVEKAGTFISSLTTIKNHRLTKDELTAIASGIVRAEIVGIPSIILKDNIVHIRVKSKIQVDTSVLDRQIEELLKDRNALDKLEEERQRVKVLESKLANLKSTELKRLEGLNQQVIQIEMEREKQRLIREEQRLKAQEDIAQTELELLKREKERAKRFALLQKEQEDARKKELELLEREQNRIKKAQIENDRYWKELSRKAENSQASWRPLDDTLSMNQALAEAIELRSDIRNITERINLQFEASKKNLTSAYENQFKISKPILPPKPAPKDAFETTEEYTQRIKAYEERVRFGNIENEIEIEKLRYEKDLEISKINVVALREKFRVLTPFIDRLEELQNIKFAVPEEKAFIEIGPPDADNARFPLTIRYKDHTWNKYWTYQDRKTARVFWKTKNNIKSQCLFRLVDTANKHLTYRFSTVKVSHLGTGQTRTFDLGDIPRFYEINSFNNIFHVELPAAEAQVDYFATAQERDKLKGVWKRDDGTCLVIEGNAGSYCAIHGRIKGKLDYRLKNEALKDLTYMGDSRWSCKAFVWKKKGAWYRYDYRSEIQVRPGRIDQVLYRDKKENLVFYYYKVYEDQNDELKSRLRNRQVVQLPNGREIQMGGIARNGESLKPVSKTKTGSQKNNHLRNAPKYYIRIYNIDDIGSAYLNNDLIKTVKYKGDSGWIEITPKLKKGTNQIKFTLLNRQGGWTYGFQVKKDDNIFWEKECGNANKGIGCIKALKERGASTKGLSNKRGTVFGKILTFKY
jgi:hypothetical protein